MTRQLWIHAPPIATSWGSFCNMGSRPVRHLALTLMALVSLGTGVGPAHGQVNLIAALEREFDRAIPGLLQESGVPGMALGLVVEGQVAWAKGYGLANTKTGARVTPDTVFQAASISKSVSAWAVMRLAEARRVDLDAPVSRYLKRWQLPASRFDTAGVTLRRILSHTAGLNVPGYSGFPPGVPLQSLTQSLTAAADAGGQGLAVVAAPGSAWHYSGGGYTLAQLMVEEVTGQSFAAYTQSAILASLGMHASRFDQPPAAEAREATSYDRVGRVAPDYRFTAQAAAGLRTTVSDLARFVAAAMSKSDGEAAGRGLLHPETVAEMLTPQPNSATDLLFQGSSWGLGYGLKQLPTRSHPLIFHPGDNIPGWHGLIAAMPAERVGLVALTNGEAGRDLRVQVCCVWLRAHGEHALAECQPHTSNATRQ
jgi:CubicO group peptidase (beta-lactamase class C family)